MKRAAIKRMAANPDGAEAGWTLAEAVARAVEDDCAVSGRLFEQDAARERGRPSVGLCRVRVPAGAL